jgi:Domain of unknown function (DUF1929)/Glyoxal oxidase N-terminus
MRFLSGSRLEFLSLVLFLLTACNPGPALDQGVQHHILLDANRNWTLDAGDTALAGAQVTLIDEAGKELANAVSNNQGYVNFKRIPEGSSFLIEVSQLSLQANQALRCKHFSGSSLCAVEASFEITTTATTTRFSTRINTALNDVEENISNGSMYVSSTDLELGADGFAQAVGLRFTNIVVPQGATITKAYLVFTVDEDGSNATSVSITADNADTSAAFSLANRNLSNRVKTSASVAWNNLPTWAVDQTYSTPELKSIVQEVVSRSGWRSGNALSFVITGSGTRTTESFEGESASAPELVIEFEGGGVIDPNAGRFSTRVRVGTDDVEENLGTGSLYLNSTDLELGSDGFAQAIGLRFPNVTLPQGVTVTKAYLTFAVDEDGSSLSSVSMSAEASDNAAVFTSSNKNVSNRLKTSSSVSWGNLSPWFIDQEFDSPELKSMVQEVLNRPGWQSGNALAFVITGSGTRTAEAFEGEALSAPELVIEYTTTPPVTLPANPSNFRAVVDSSVQVSLSWNVVGNATGYSLERKVFGQSYTNLASVTTSGYTDSSVSADTVYVYRLKATNSAGPSSGVEVQVTTFPSGPNGGAQAASKGFFGPVNAWPLIATHAALLPDGRIISWYSYDRVGVYRDQQNAPQYHSSTIVDAWNPNDDSHQEFNNSTSDMFCSAWTVLNNGKLLVAGGNLGTPNGSKHLNLFDPLNNTWSRSVDMTAGRWYPTATKLANGEVLISGGTTETGQVNRIHEVYQLDGTLRQLTGASTAGRNFEHYYPWWHVAPNGQVFYTGASPQMTYLTTLGSGSWGTTYTRDTRYRTYGSSVMYQPGKILVMGGGGNNNTAVSIDITNNVQVTTVNSMNYGRTHLNATLLANGTIFVNGGNNGTNFDDSTSIYDSEIWNPQTGQWNLGARAAKPRNYHAVSLLLPDATVWTAGGGGCGANCAANQQSAEIYYPNYLFQKNDSGKLAARPKITAAPSSIGYNQNFSISSPHAQSIQSVSLVSLGATTHAFNMNQRFINITIQNRGLETLELLSPTSGNLAPPGFYMLFAIDTNGVPSVAKILKIE